MDFNNKPWTPEPMKVQHTAMTNPNHWITSIIHYLSHVEINCFSSSQGWLGEGWGGGGMGGEQERADE